MKILVLGKNGYVSKCFQNYMKNYKGYIVEAISVRDDKWKNISFKEYDVIFNTIGLAHNDARKGTENEFYRLNTELPYELACKAKKEGVKQFIHMSSMIVYGNISKIGKVNLITEKTIPQPVSIYGKSKLKGEEKLQTLKDKNFSIVLIRSPLIYGVKAVDNISKLIKFSQKIFIFPNIKNNLSMIYDENLCELIRLIIENNSSGTFCPQMERSICTSDFVKDIGFEVGHKIILTKIFNPLLNLLSNKFLFIQKMFGSQIYDLPMSNYFDGKYRLVTYKRSIELIIKKQTLKNREEC